MPRCPGWRSAERPEPAPGGATLATIAKPGEAERNPPPPEGGGDVPLGRLFIWSAGRAAWLGCPPDEITWLDRDLLSGNSDLTLHRAPRCAGLRYVHHRWELFSRDPTHRVYLAPHGGSAQDHRTVRTAAQRVLPVAPAQHYETLPVVLDEGAWLVSVGRWVLPVRLEAPVRRGAPAPVRGREQPPTQEERVRTSGSPVRRGGQPRPDAVAEVRRYFGRNPAARLAMAYHYQEFVLGAAAPQPVPMTDVVIALDLSGEGAVSDYKKLLQGFIWSERGHPRELPEFLLANGLLTHSDLTGARQLALENERTGRSEMARQRLRYRVKQRRHGPGG